LPPASTHAHRS